VIDLTHFLFHLAQPASLLVMAMYWTLDYPIWELCIFKADEQPCRDIPHYTGLFVHGINALLLIFSFLIGNITFRFAYSCIVLVAYSTAYGLWSLVHYWAKIGTYRGCDAYSQDECPLYGVFDWHHPVKAAIVLVAVIILLPTCGAVYVCLGRVRGCCKPRQLEESAAEVAVHLGEGTIDTDLETGSQNEQTLPMPTLLSPCEIALDGEKKDAGLTETVGLAIGSILGTPTNAFKELDCDHSLQVEPRATSWSAISNSAMETRVFSRPVQIDDDSRKQDRCGFLCSACKPARE